MKSIKFFGTRKHKFVEDIKVGDTIIVRDFFNELLNTFVPCKCTVTKVYGHGVYDVVRCLGDDASLTLGVSRESIESFSPSNETDVPEVKHGS